MIVFDYMPIAKQIQRIFENDLSYFKNNKNSDIDDGIIYKTLLDSNDGIYLTIHDGFT